MFEFELRQYRNPDCKVPATKNRKTGTVFPESYSIDYWKDQYYRCLWGQELADTKSILKDYENLRKLEKLIVKYLQEQGCNPVEWLVDEVQRRRKASDLSSLKQPNPQEPERRKSAQFAAVSSRLRFQRAVVDKLGETVIDDDYPKFVETLNLYLEYQRITGEQKPADSDSQEGASSEGTSPTKEGPQGPPVAGAVSFTEFHSIVEGDHTLYFDPQADQLVEQEEQKQIQQVLDSGLGSVVQGYYSYTLSDQELLSSPGESTAAETDPGSEEEATSSHKPKTRLQKSQSRTFRSSSGDPGDPESSPSESSDDSQDPEPPSRPSTPTEGGQGEPGGDQDRDQERDQGNDRQASKMTPAKDAHLGAHKALEDRLQEIEAAAHDHLDGKALMSATSADVYVKELDRMHPKLEELAVGCYLHFPDDKTVDLALNPRYQAVNTQTKLKNNHHRIITKMIDIHKSLSTTVTGSPLKTPKIAVPKFSGLHRDWPTFKSEFNALVKNNNTYSSTEKMRLLIDALSDGDAKDNISDLTVTNELPLLMSQSESGLHKLISTIRTTKAQLKQVNLGGVSEADVLYLHFIMARLDTKTIKEFNQTLTSNEVPSLQTCIDFLEMQAKNVGLTKEIKSNSAAAAPSKHRNGRDHKESKALTITSDSEAGYSTDDSRKHVRFRKSINTFKKRGRSKSPSILKKSVNVATKAKGTKTRDRSSSRESGHTKARPNPPFKPRPCSYCGKHDHRISKCGTFGSMSVNQRREWVRTNKRCYNCLGIHQVSDCAIERTCFVCRKRHHTLLHSEGTEPKVTKNINIVLHQSGSNEHTGLLPTASVIIPNQIAPAEARCLLDTGAQENFVTNELVVKLRLPRTKVKEGFVAAGGQGLTTLGKTTFRIQSTWDSSESFKIQAYILDTITSELPHQEINISTFDHLKNIELADMFFNKPAKIDILLGVTVVARIMRDRKARIGHRGSPNAYYTDLGWIVMGSVIATGPRSVMAIYGSNPPLEHTMEKFWTIEELPTSNPHLTREEQNVLDHYEENTIRLPNGQYQVRLPFVENPRPLGDSKQMAMRRWIAVERRLMKDPDLMKSYGSSPRRRLGIMREVDQTLLEKNIRSRQLQLGRVGHYLGLYRSSSEL
ncbi:unnamed protein product [Allacma fusca]|uniref:Peptidase A2 domain-containing protein n=1 Tax=Allacma fusca TaxID=39272 RepID=A0A8J2LAR4_9HEXA|nr:unnamed protein product [Allacma fusca]